MLKIALSVCMALSVCLVLFSSYKDSTASPAACADTQKAARISSPDGPDETVYALFPDLSGITAIAIRTPDRSFQFRYDSRGDVSVNGRQADGEVYNTLVSQIMELPVNDQAAFDPEGAQLLLTLEVTAGRSEHIARFYTDGAAGEEARIVSGTESAPRYHRTEGWRVGTLMMTCEGTRIQDERGNEMPVSY